VRVLPRSGQAVQVDPFKPTVKAPGTKRLNLQYGEPLSNFAFKFNLHRYTPVTCACSPARRGLTILVAPKLAY